MPELDALELAALGDRYAAWVMRECPSIRERSSATTAEYIEGVIAIAIRQAVTEDRQARQVEGHPCSG